MVSSMDGLVMGLMALAPLDDILPPGFLSLRTLLFAVACYVYGSIPFALIFTRLFSGQSVSGKGTGNIGVANAFGVGGLQAGFLTVAGETSKVVLPVALARYYYDGDITVSLALVFAAVLGASFSIFLRGKGGMATTLLLFALLALSPFSLLAFASGAVILLLTTKRSDVTAIGSYVLLPAGLFLIERSIPFLVFGALVAVLYCSRYRRARSDYAFYVRGGRRFLPGVRTRYVVPLSSADQPAVVGLKARNLCFLERAGFSVPRTHVCTFRAFDDHASGVTDVRSQLQKELKRLVDEERSYCVRSSASLEDKAYHSFAGQFESYLNVRSVSSVVEAIEHVWASLAGSRARSYLHRMGQSSRDAQMAAIIQEMVSAQLSGVVFTKNPVSGMDEIIVEAVPGFGDALVQAGVTPDRWVYKWGNWLEVPHAEEKVPAVITQVVQQARRIARKYGRPVDLEWAYDGKELYWLQLREITTLSGVNVYSNRISREFMPGIIKPLVWSVNIPVVNSSWKRLLVELVGGAAREINIDRLAESFYYRAYFNMGVVGDLFELLGMPRETIEILTGIEVPGHDAPRFRPGLKAAKYIPRMVLSASRKMVYAVRMEKLVKAQRAAFDEYQCVDLEKLSEVEALDRIEGLMRTTSEASYHVIVSRLLAGLTNTLLKKAFSTGDLPLDGPGRDREKKALRDIDVGYHLARLYDVYQGLPEKAKRQVSRTPFHELARIPELGEFVLGVREFLSRFGHLSESGNDFSGLTWQETPDLVLQMVVSHQRSAVQQVNRQEMVAPARGPVRRALLKTIRTRIVRLRTSTERMNFVYGFGYALLRPYFMRLARLFREAACIDEEDDIFYLTLDEVREIVRSGRMSSQIGARLLQRKHEVRQYDDVSLPEVIVGDTPLSVSTRVAMSHRLRGIAVAKGYCEGPVKVVRGLEDFGKVGTHDIVVIPFSDVSWTPFLSNATGIISASGGMLSHCAVVAREYGIPAVVSVPGAMELKDGTFVAVDGLKGEIVVLQQQ